MDRAWIVRIVFRPLLLAALMIQTLTPDFLDHTLLAQSLPPGPLFVVSSFSGPSGVEGPRDDFFPGRACALPDAADSERAESGGSPEELCQPIWPELGVTPIRYLGSSPRQKFRVERYHPSIVGTDEVPAVRPRVPLSLVAELPPLLCRFLF